MKFENLDKEAVSNMSGIVHCDASSDGQQHLIRDEDVKATMMTEDI